MTEGLTDQELETLARAFSTPIGATQLLERAGLERSRHPHWAARSPLQFWGEIDNLLRDGALPGGRQGILAAAARLYPANRVFAAAGSPAEVPPPGAGPALRTAEASGAGRSAPHGGLPVHVTVFVLDAVGYSRHGILVQLEWRQGLRDIVGEALRHAGIPEAATQLQDSGDGFRGIVGAEMPKAVVVADFARELGIALRTYNLTRDEDRRIRLRLALHDGEVIASGGTGFAGDAVVVAARLVDAPAVRRALELAPAAYLALIVSAALYGSTVRLRLRGLDPDTFREVDVNVPKFTGTAWVTVPGLAIPAGVEPPVEEMPRSPATTAEPGDGDGWDFLISAAEADEGWGAWVAWQLERLDYRVHLETWDVQAGDHRVGRLDDAIRNSKRTVVVLSDNYLRSSNLQAEWHAAWQTDADGMQRKLIPVRVAECEPGGLLRGIRYIDLVGLGDAAAEAHLVEQIKRSVDGRYRPTSPPPFPGRAPAR